jgi:hypothetical protein
MADNIWRAGLWRRGRVVLSNTGFFAHPPKRVYSSMGALGMGKVGMSTGG